ncbi:hypothetical protein EV363DRAFT_1431518 [Boletus edulis]|uniref:Uncharacterized protein n=1 Tax=Boletus edulis BED1 TaxID=1328754 RepID=A0AAD4GG39_BOLED|nr:hypothetical protein EV363DRAFT_1261794 [Boletus edulis]KAF8131537.1 hypothetical protein EV363DRAFT_1431518 [Boletus edulis]KAF8440777.1 hypothetical protein L210DRAFT_3503729 [Boletus edulis BED1]
MFDMFLESQMPLSGWLKSLKSHPCLQTCAAMCPYTGLQLTYLAHLCGQIPAVEAKFSPRAPTVLNNTNGLSTYPGHAIGIYYTSALVTLLIVGDAYRDPLELMPGMTIRESFKSKVVRRLNRALYR